jgi:hypothetical protein
MYFGFSSWVSSLQSTRFLFAGTLLVTLIFFLASSLSSLARPAADDSRDGEEKYSQQEMRFGFLTP